MIQRSRKVRNLLEKKRKQQSKWERNFHNQFRTIFFLTHESHMKRELIKWEDGGMGEKQKGRGEA